MNIRRIKGTVTGKKNVTYYFFPTVNKEEALLEAKEYREPKPQCWDKWSVHSEVHRPEVITVHGQKFKAPSPGLILKFEHGSCD